MTLLAGDKNGDGKLSREEGSFFPAWKTGFDRFDTNKDGFVDKAEFNAVKAGKASGEPGDPPSEPKPKTESKKPGTALWKFQTGSGVPSSPAIGSDGTVYVGSVGSMYKKLYAIKTNSKGLAKSPWPMCGQNAQHTGRTVAVPSLEAGRLDQGGEAPKVVVGFKQLGERDGLWHLKGKPFTGIVVWKSDNGRKKWERTFKEGKRDGLQTSWYDNGQKKWEGTFKGGEKISDKRWGEDGSRK